MLKRLIFIILSLNILCLNNLYSQDYNEEEQNPPIDIPIIKAIAEDDINTLKNIINSGEDLEIRDEQGNTPLIWAALYGNFDIVR